MHHQQNLVVLNETLRTATPSPQEENLARFAVFNKEKPKLLPEYTFQQQSSIDRFPQKDGSKDEGEDGMNLQCTCRREKDGEFVTELSAIFNRDNENQFNSRTEDDQNDNRARSWKSYQTTVKPTEGEEEDDEDEEAIPTTVNPVKNQRHEDLQAENFEVGIMFASKPIVQAITNPFVGTMTNR